MQRLNGVEPGFLEQVDRDVQARAVAKVPHRHRPARLGLQTVARLLADCEPFRVRWAMQHWPYPIAKIIRSLMPAPGQLSAPLLEGESLILKTAWDRLNVEGKLSRAWQGEGLTIGGSDR
jgi:hypothetical protein